MNSEVELLELYLNEGKLLGLRFRVSEFWILGFRVWGVGLRFHGLGCRA